LPHRKMTALVQKKNFVANECYQHKHYPKEYRP